MDELETCETIEVTDLTEKIQVLLSAEDKHYLRQIRQQSGVAASTYLRMLLRKDKEDKESKEQAA